MAVNFMTFNEQMKMDIRIEALESEVRELRNRTIILNISVIILGVSSLIALLFR